MINFTVNGIAYRTDEETLAKFRDCVYLLNGFKNFVDTLDFKIPEVIGLGPQNLAYMTLMSYIVSGAVQEQGNDQTNP